MHRGRTALARRRDLAETGERLIGRGLSVFVIRGRHNVALILWARVCARGCGSTESQFRLI